MYIAVLDEFPDFMVPTLVAHSVLNAHINFQNDIVYQDWLINSFKKCVLRVNQKEFDKISKLPHVHLGHENKTLDGKPSCAVVCPIEGELPNVLKFAKLWSPVNRWPKHKPEATLHDIIIDGVSRDFLDDRIIEETNGLADKRMIDIYRKRFMDDINSWQLKRIEK